MPLLEPEPVWMVIESFGPILALDGKATEALPTRSVQPVMSTAWLLVFCKVSVESVGETLALRMRTGEAAVAVPATVAPAVVAVAELADELVAVDGVLASEELDEGVLASEELDEGVLESEELDEGVLASDGVDDEGVLDGDEPVEADGVLERVEPVEADGVLDVDALPDGVPATAPVELVTPAVVVPLAGLPETGVLTALDPVVEEATPLVGVVLGADEQATSAVRAAAPAMLRSHVRFGRMGVLLRRSRGASGRMRANARGRSPGRGIAGVGATGE